MGTRALRFTPHGGIGLRMDDTEQRVLSAELSTPDSALERYAAELELLREMGIAISATLDPAEILRLVCERSRDLFDAPFTAAALPRPDGRAWECGGAGAAELLDRVALRFATRLAAGETVVEGAAPPHGTQHVGAVVGVPLRHGDQVHGTLLLGWERPRALALETVRLAETLGVHVAASLQNARLMEEMRSSTLRRDRFFSAVSHDLRTPITAIIGYSELLLDGVAGDLAHPQREMIERISHVSGHLSQLVGDILDLTRLDAGRVKFHRECVSLRALLEDAVVAVQPQARHKGLGLTVDLGAAADRRVSVDRFRVRQVLVNLLSNAVKFTQAGEVRVSACCDDGETRIAVADTGPGIPPGSEESIFEEFFQLASGCPPDGEPGSGLGLAISRRLARAMGGELSVRSACGEGSVFTLHLPESPDA
jgi:signal transduction histidine kinase